MTARQKFRRAALRQRAARERRTPRPARPEGMITLTEAATHYHRAESGLYKACQKGQLPSLKQGHNRYLLHADVERYMAQALESRRQEGLRLARARRASITARKAGILEDAQGGRDQ